MRVIKEGTTIRLGNVTYGPGDEDKLYEAIDPDSAALHVQAGRLEGDWSGAQAGHQTRVAAARTRYEQDETMQFRLLDRRTRRR